MIFIYLFYKKSIFIEYCTLISTTILWDGDSLRDISFMLHHIHNGVCLLYCSFVFSDLFEVLAQFIELHLYGFILWLISFLLKQNYKRERDSLLWPEIMVMYAIILSHFLKII